MSLNIEWKTRVDQWRETLGQRIVRPLGPLDVQGFITKEQLRPEQAMVHDDYQAMPPGTAWGGKWEYAWFRTTITVPSEAEGQRLVFSMETGQESLVFVNGVACGAFDHWHKQLTLSTAAVPGDTYLILVETYAGHGLQNTSGGPQLPGTESVPEPAKCQCKIGLCTLGIWNEQVYQLHMDVSTLYYLREQMQDTESLRLAEIDQGLRDFTTIVDMELSDDQFMETVQTGRKRLAPLLACVNGSTSPDFFAFGHAHIDTAWLWPIAECQRKCERTFANQLGLMEEYPEYQFLCSQPHQYRWIKQNNPQMYEQIKAAVKRGQWIAEGGMWIEADTNITGGESLIRQFVHGMRFFKEEFDVDSEVMWLPDVFGYSAALPQIMAGCGSKYFSTHKIMWVYTDFDPFPYSTFAWEGMDGTRIGVHIHSDYTAPCDPGEVIRQWHDRRQKDGLSTRLYPFGWGDGGGGPTRDHLEYLRREKDLEGMPRMKMATPNAFFRDLEVRGYPDACYVGELYFQTHRGTYTSQAKTKLGNRKSEIALHESEMWCVAAASLSGYTVPLEAFDETWKLVLLNQFHDILPGSSIHRVHEEAEADFAKAISSADQMRESATAALTDDSDAITVFNSLSWPRTELVALSSSGPMADVDGNALPAQTIEGRAHVEVTVPSCGWTTIRSTAEVAEVARGVTATDRCLENDLVKVDFDEFGQITSIFDKIEDRELASGLCNAFHMYRDIPGQWDAWDIDRSYMATPVALEGPAQMEVLATGPLLAQLSIDRKLHGSKMRQVVSLRRGSRRVVFHTTVDWVESHKLLKVNFPVDYRNEDALHEIQFGHVRRPTHKNRPYDADRFEVPQQRWTALTEEGRGFAVLNDCKYGVNVAANSINLTLLKSAVAPDMTADKGTQAFTYAITFWHDSFMDCDVVQQGYQLNVPVVSESGSAGSRSLFQVYPANVIIETVKPAEDGSGDVVIRMYESKRTATRCTLSTTLAVSEASWTDMCERKTSLASCRDGEVMFDLHPFEIKTLKLHLKEGVAR